MSDKTIRYVMHDKLCTYSYRTGYVTGPVLGNHMHIYYEFINIIEGNALYNVEGQEYEISAGDIVFTNPNEFHFISFPKGTLYSRQFLQIDSRLVNGIKANILDVLNARTFGQNNKIPADIVSKYNLLDIFKGVEEYSVKKNDDTDLMLSLYCAQLIIKVSEILQKEFLVNDTSAKHKHIKAIYDYIEKNFTKPIKVDDIANAVYLNKSYISRLFKSKTALTLSAYINIRRIMLAKNLLLGGKNATDIFFDCGFNDYSTFYRSFKAYVGTSPEDFKKNNL